MSHQESEHEAEEREPRHGKKGPRKPRPFGIRYEWMRWFRSAEKWYTTRTGRDQAFKRMERENEGTRRATNQKFRLYKTLEKIEK